MGHSVRILSGSEDGNLVVWRSECFDPFKRLLPIIQAGCHAVYAEVGVFDKFGLGPFSRLDAVMGLDVATDCTVGQSRLHMRMAAWYMPSRTRKPMSAQSASY